jgi:hypothetical protein
MQVIVTSLAFIASGADVASFAPASTCGAAFSGDLFQTVT